MNIKNVFVKLFRKLSMYVRNDGLNSFFVIFQNHITVFLRYIFYKVIFGWDVKFSSSGAYIRGSRHMLIGKNFCFRSGLWLEAVTDFQGKRYSPRITIGNNLSAGNYLHIAATNSVSIGNDVLIGSKVLITDHLHGFYSGAAHSHPRTFPNIRPLTSDRPVLIEDNVFIGDNVCILPGVTIGFGAIIGANSVVVHDVPQNCIVAGNPAIVIKKFIEAEHKWKRV